jgi:hypothetical protein
VDSAEPQAPEAPEASAADAARVEQLLDSLEAAGARGYDAEACDCVRALLTRAEELRGPVGERLVARAFAHVCALRDRYRQDQERVRARLESIDVEPEICEALEKLVARGELIRAARNLRRLAALPESARRGRGLSASEGRDVLVGAKAPRGATHSERRKRVVAYEDSVAALVASFALARAVDVVPEDAGPYNPLRIASETLDRIREVSPFYLTVQLNRLEELASLLALPELPQKVEEKAFPKKKTRTLKGSRS